MAQAMFISRLQMHADMSQAVDFVRETATIWWEAAPIEARVRLKGQKIKEALMSQAKVKQSPDCILQFVLDVRPSQRGGQGMKMASSPSR